MGDRGGRDTLDMSDHGAAIVLDLRPGSMGRMGAIPVPSAMKTHSASGAKVMPSLLKFPMVDGRANVARSTNRPYVGDAAFGSMSKIFSSPSHVSSQPAQTQPTSLSCASDMMAGHPLSNMARRW